MSPAARARAVASGVVLAALVACGRGDVERPAYRCRDCNVVLISVDTLRADHVGAYGYPVPTTPNIDALAARGVLFENAISQSSWTRPAHLSMFTGLHPAEHGVVALKDRRRSEPPATLAAAMQARGYRTAAFTGGGNLDAAFGFDRGFQTYRNNGTSFRDNLEDTRYWLARHKDERFFLFWHGYDPHTPYRSDPIDRTALGLTSPPRRGLRRVCRSRRGPARIAAHVAEYDGAVRRADRYVGKLLRHLDELALLDRTVVVLTSDHGEEFLEHGRCFHLNTLYREVLHVPLVVAAPGLPPRRAKSLVPASVSIGATILEIVGATDSPLPGPSLAQALVRDVADGAVVSETSHERKHGGSGHVRALTTATEKLVYSVGRDRAVYFDLTADPGERRPVTDGRRLRAMKRQLSGWTERHPRRAGAGAEVPGPDQADLKARLRSLGYVD